MAKRSAGLLVAAPNGCVQSLLNAGVHADTRGPSNRTPLHHAAVSAQSSGYSALL